MTRYHLHMMLGVSQGLCWQVRKSLSLIGIRTLYRPVRSKSQYRLNCPKSELSTFVCFWHNSPQWVMASLFTRFLYHTRRTTVGRTPLDEWSARRRDLYLTTHSTHNRQTSMPPVGFEPTISAGKRPQNYALDRAATGTGLFLISFTYIEFLISFCICYKTTLTL